MKKIEISEKLAKLAKENEALAILLLYKYLYRDLELLLVILLMDQYKYSLYFVDNCKHVLAKDYPRIVLQRDTLLKLCISRDLLRAASGIASSEASAQDSKMLKESKQWMKENI